MNDNQNVKNLIVKLYLKEGNEIDFIWKRAAKIVAIEVKSSNRWKGSIIPPRRRQSGGARKPRARDSNRVGFNSVELLTKLVYWTANADFFGMDLNLALQQTACGRMTDSSEHTVDL